jgi:hypothetical protein
MNDQQCALTQAVIAELAFDVAEPTQRAHALRHTASCPHCSQDLERACEAADLILLVAPQHLPDLTPHDLVQTTMHEQPAPSLGSTTERRLTRRLAVAGCMIAGLVAFAATTSNQHPPNVASRTATLNDSTGQVVGSAVLTDGRVPALFLSFRARGRPFTYTVLATGKSPTPGTFAIGLAKVTDGICTFSHQLPLPIANISRILLQGPNHDTTYHSQGL